MSKVLKITLGGTKYEVPKLNVGQVREVTRLFRNEEKAEISFDVLKIAFARVDGIDDFEAIEAGLDEISEAAAEILLHAGFKKDEGKNPPKAPGSTG